MGTINDFFKKRLAAKILQRIDSKLQNDANKTLYQKSFGTYELTYEEKSQSKDEKQEDKEDDKPEDKVGQIVQGELLIEFNEDVPKDGIYYGFKLKEIEISANNVIDQCFAAFIEHLEYALKKTVYIADNNNDKTYWVFWLRDDNATIDEIISDMELIRDYFNQLVLFSKLKLVKVL